MRRALDAGRAKLATLTGRDEILECFFEQARAFFRHAVLLVVRGDTAHGKSVHGLEAPDSLVEKIIVPLNAPSSLQRARELRRPIVGVPNLTDVDQQLFGTLGRAMPGALVSPLVVRDRVVALFIGDVPADILQFRASEAGRSPMDLAKEEMLIWSEAVSEALERLIIRKKGGSVPPPALAGTPTRSSIPPPPRLPRTSSPPRVSVHPDVMADPAVDAAAPAAPPPEAAPPQRRSAPVWLVLLLVAGLAGGGYAFFKSRMRDVEPDRVATAATALPGYPDAVDPIAVADLARRATPFGDGAETISMRAEVGRGGHVSFAGDPQNAEGIFIDYLFAGGDREAAVRVDRIGIHSASISPRKQCGSHPCAATVPPATCSFAQVFDAAFGAASGADDRALVTYRAELERPVWLVDVVGRGRMHVDAATCKPLPRERLRPPSMPLAAVPGKHDAIEPLDILALAKKQAGLDEDAVVVEIDVAGIGTKGTVDVTQPGATIAYTLSDPPSVPADRRRWRRVELTREGLRVTEDELTRGPLDAKFDLALAAPRCSFAQAAAYLTRDGTALSSGARVVYGAEPGGHKGRWSVVGEGDFRKVDDLDCEAWANIATK